jgi:hypothetical protein
VSYDLTGGLKQPPGNTFMPDASRPNRPSPSGHPQTECLHPRAVIAHAFALAVMSPVHWVTSVCPKLHALVALNFLRSRQGRNGREFNSQCRNRGSAPNVLFADSVKTCFVALLFGHDAPLSAVRTPGGIDGLRICSPQRFAGLRRLPKLSTASSRTT